MQFCEDTESNVWEWGVVEVAKRKKYGFNFGQDNGLRSGGKPTYEEGTKIIFDDLSCEVAAWGAIICAILGTLGNVLTITVLLTKKSLRGHTTTPFLLSLAFSDLLFCTFCLPLTAVRFFKKAWVFKMCTCQLFPFFFYANISISAFSMAFIALNRFVGIYCPRKMDTFFSYWKSMALVAFIWALSLGIMALPLTKTWGQLGYDPQIFSCTILPRYDKSPMKFNMIMGFLLPSLIMAGSYFMIYRRVRAVGNQMRDAIDEDDVDHVVENHLKKREHNITRTGLLVCMSFIICFMPSALIMALHPMPPHTDMPGLHVAGYIIFWCSGFVNPVIYIVSNKYYREAMLETFCRKFARRYTFTGANVYADANGEFDRTTPHRFTVPKAKTRQDRQRNKRFHTDPEVGRHLHETFGQVHDRPTTSEEKIQLNSMKSVDSP